jgi:ribosomal protein S18 acetylase RimI-like enzyme
MAEFYTALSAPEMAEQIANMLNTHNRLTTKHYGAGLVNAGGKYFVELERDKVIGCVGIVQETPNLTKVFHACVLPEFRKHGIAKKLMRIAINQCKTSHIYGTVRSDNEASLSMVKGLGFVYVKKDWHKDHDVITVGRRLS